MAGQTPSKISTGSAALMIMVSVLIDIVQFLLDFIPVIGWIINIVIADSAAGLIYYIWFKTKGVSFGANKKALAGFIIGYIVDYIPFISGFAWTLDVFLVIAAVRSEERAIPSVSVVAKTSGGAEAQNATKPKVVMAVQADTIERNRRNNLQQSSEVHQRNLELRDTKFRTNNNESSSAHSSA